MIRQDKKGQSILEYAILLGVVIAALLIMQVFVKRGFQGGLKDAADKMGEQFSASNTSISQKRTLGENQVIKEEIGTKAGSGIANFTNANITGTLDKGVYSYTDRSYANQTSLTKVSTDSATQEKTRWNQYSNATEADFNITNWTNF